MRVAKGGTAGQPSSKPTNTFTGEVLMDPVFVAQDGVATATVLFTPGARTYWHSHEYGQVLFVARGRGVVVNREGESRSIVSGDIVHASPGEIHWHGGSSESFMVHTAVSLGETKWLGEVSEEDYKKYSN